MSRQLLTDCRRLLSVRGEASGPALAAGIVSRLEALADAERYRFFDRLASDFRACTVGTDDASGAHPGSEST